MTTASTLPTRRCLVGILTLLLVAAAGCTDKPKEAVGPAFFDDEAAALAAFQADPSPTNRANLARIRAIHGYRLLEQGQNNRDPDAITGAIRYAHSAKELVPDNAMYHFLLAQAYGENGDSPAGLALAASAARRALELAPADNRIRLYLGQLLFRQKYFASALANFEIAITSDLSLAQPPLISMMTVAYVMDVLALRGERFMLALLAAQPDNHAARLSLAVLLHHQGGAKDPLAYAELRKVQIAPTASQQDRDYAVKLATLWPQEVPIGNAQAQGVRP